ncbi:MAG: helix-turn-helix transcriptional regulator [Clostridia bacterium]|nr:helix-turn-helix transcriptional regulator [Clostridia bacterium]
MEKGYIKTRPKTVVDITKIVTIHYYEVGKGFVFDGERHDFWEMVYVDKGSVSVTRDGEEIVLSQGEIVFHRPNEFHTIRAFESAPNFFVISFVSSSLCMQYFERFCTKIGRVHKSLLSCIIEEAERSYDIPKNNFDLRQLKRKKDAPLGSEQLIKSYMEQLLIYLLRSAEKNTDAAVVPPVVEEQPLVSAVKEYITSRCEENVRIDEICRAFGYSKSFLSRLFREHTGTSLASFAMAKRMERAKELLRDEQLNVTQIAARLSFENPQYFARVFKRECNMTPSEWKQLAHK